MKEEKTYNIKAFLTENVNYIIEALNEKINTSYNRETSEEDALIEIINKAHEEWENAQMLFDNVSDPDLIDHAIYKVEAARSRYIYLLKKAKEEGVKINTN